MEENSEAVVQRVQTPIVDKAVFPGLLNRLWHTLSAGDAVVGFRGSGIMPLELEKMKRQIVLRNEMGSLVRNENIVSDPVTPNSAIRKAVRSVLAPVQSNESEEILKNKARKRTQVQVKTGEVLTSETCVRTLLEEQEKCNAKQKNTKKTQKKSQDDDDCDEMDDLDSEGSEEKDENQSGASSDIRPGDYVKIIQGDFVEYFACVEENISNNMFHIQYFKSQFGEIFC